MFALLQLLFLFLTLSNQVLCDFSFSFSSFDTNSCRNDSNLICMGSVTAGNGTLNITPDMEQQQLQRQQPNDKDPNSFMIGRVLYRYPVLAWPATFSTTFTVRIVPDKDSGGCGDGMSFIIAQDDRPSPPESYGSFLGILDPSTQGGILHQLAVELDTYKNEFEHEPDGNHIAIDTTSVINPVAVKSLNSTGIDLNSGRDITVQIDYNGWDKTLQIYVAYAGSPLVSFLNQSIIMKNTVPSQVYVGFTGSTGTLRETHQVVSWSFTSTELPKGSLKNGHDKRKTKILLAVLLPILLSVTLLAAFAFPFFLRAMRKRKERSERKVDIEILTRNAANAPRMFTYKKLSKATRNFSKENLLGTGGFGSVYKGCLSDPPSTIAVKKISATSSQGEKEYLAEICTIGRLRHKNLLQLQGWCHDREQLLLVYEYMPNGSLDRYIGKINLDWKTRYDILTGLASVLVYLHEECGNSVVHRDVKPNNVMLDSEFNAHLGDFGLARLLQNDTAVTTMVAGTPGYLAPEVSFTGRATPESDVYSFGMVVVEVVCGKRSKGMMDENSLVELVWEMYEKDTLLGCVDQMLEKNYDEEQVRRALMVGLACLHPDYTHRPKMRKVVQVLMNKDEPLMNLPSKRPLEVCLSFCSSSATSTTMDFASSTAPGGGGSVGSSPEEITIRYDA